MFWALQGWVAALERLSTCLVDVPQDGSGGALGVRTWQWVGAGTYPETDNSLAFPSFLKSQNSLLSPRLLMNR